MKYKVEWIEEKTSAKGTKYRVCSFTDETGKRYDNVSTFDVVELSQTYDGDIVTNGQYTNFKLAKEPKKFDRSTTIAVAQERKEQSIIKLQDRKEESIAYFNSCNLAIQTIGQYDPAKWESVKHYENDFEYWRNFYFKKWYSFNLQDFIDPTK